MVKLYQVLILHVNVIFGNSVNPPRCKVKINDKAMNIAHRMKRLKAVSLFVDVFNSCLY